MKRSRRITLPTWAFLAIGQRDRWTCHICEQGYKPSDKWDVDHDRALARGGTNHLSNLRLAHRCCNSEKASA